MSGSAAQRPIRESDLLPSGRLARLGLRVHLFEAIDSTNTFLKSQGDGAMDGEIALAEFQTAGRGRGDHAWLAPRGSSILLSVGLIEPADSPLLAMAAVAACVAGCEAIEAETSCRANVRWPNDLAVKGRKLGGVLAESSPLPGSAPRRRLVIGIGINCLQQRGHFATQLADKATSLELECPETIDRPRLAGRLVQRLDAWLSRCDVPQLAALHAAWVSRSADIGTFAHLLHDGAEYTGTILEILAGGDLCVRLVGGETRVFPAAATSRRW